MREDYSEGGDAWNYFTHDQARSRAYRWGEDGLAGISDDQQRLCFALALWNGKDPILKERLFGLTNSESNHGEDVKEYYFYLDSTPTHSYMKYLYKYPQAAYPYADLVETSRRRGRHEFEYELLDTGVFDEDRYFDVFVEYAKESPEDILIQISVHNRGPEPAELHVLPTLWFRNQWSWHGSRDRPTLAAGRRRSGAAASSRPSTPSSGERYLYCEGDVPLLFTENETNTQRIFGVPNRTPVRQGRHQRLRRPRPGGGRESGEDRDQGGGPLRLTVGPGECQVDPAAAHRRRAGRPRRGATATRRARSAATSTRSCRLARNEADEFYAAVIPPVARRRRGQRHAPGPGGHAVEQAVLPLRRRQVAGGARLRPVQGRRARPRRATTTGTTCTTAT